MKYALIRNGNLDQIKEWGDETPPDLSHKIGDTLKWLPYVETAKPSYDSLTQELSSSISIGATEVTKTWSAVTKSKEELKLVVDQKEAELVEEKLGGLETRLGTLTKATMLLDALGQGQIQNDDADLVSLRGLGTWWSDVQAHSADLKAQIDADGSPDITAGWPTV